MGVNVELYARAFLLLSCNDDIHSKGLDDHQPFFQNGDSILVTITRTRMQQCAFDGTVTETRS